MSKNPYMWKTREKQEKEDFWPKKIQGHNFIYDPSTTNFYVIGGDFLAYDNLVKTQEYNLKMFKEAEKDLKSYKDVSKQKISYLTDIVYSSDNKSKSEILFYNYDQNHWSKQTVKGNRPRATGFQEAVLLGLYLIRKLHFYLRRHQSGRYGTKRDHK